MSSYTTESIIIKIVRHHHPDGIKFDSIHPYLLSMPGKIEIDSHEMNKVCWKLLGKKWLKIFGDKILLGDNALFEENFYIDPQAILDQISNRPEEWSGKILTFSGKTLDLSNPDPIDINLNDILWGMSHKYRYGGHANPAITVSEHNVLVGFLIDWLWPGNPELVKAGTLHDSCEGYTQDMTIRLRIYLKVCFPNIPEMDWDEFDLMLNRSIFKKLKIDPDLLDDPRLHAADKLASSFEERDSKNLNCILCPAMIEKVSHFQMEFLSPMKAYEKISRRCKELGINE